MLIAILAWGAIGAQASPEQRPDSQVNPATQPSLSPIFQEQNQDSAPERLREAAEEEKDLLNILD
jgi:hypothetical protein